MSQYIVAIVHRDCWSWPKLTITVEGRFKTPSAADSFISKRLRAIYEKRRGRHWSKWNSMRIFDFRVVDAQGLKRLQAAAAASRTVRRKRAALKGAITRARNKGDMVKANELRQRLNGVTRRRSVIHSSY